MSISKQANQQTRSFSLPIGIFDSGVGGLTLVKEVFLQLPNEKVVYFGDTARVPYGTKSKETVTHFATEIVRFLVQREVKLIIVACNTASAYALGELHKKFKRIPIIGVIEPGTKAALRATSSQRIGVIGTEGTIRSRAYERAFEKLNLRKSKSTLRVFSHPCPLFVPLVEEGWLNKKVTQEIAQEYLAPLKNEKIDVLLLGCTHYPLLKKVIQETIGEKVTIIDSASETVKEVKKLLGEKNLLRQSKLPPKHRFYVSDAPEKFQSLSKHFLGLDYKKVSPIHLKRL